MEELKIESALGMDLVVDGNVPTGSGLSSSSALVCASALATAAMCRARFGSREISRVRMPFCILIIVLGFKDS